LRARVLKPIQLTHLSERYKTRTPRIVLNIVTMEVKRVIVDTWHPSPVVRSSNRSGPSAQMNLYLSGASSGKARDKESLGKGRHVDDC
jgi:hypothetical protein